ncbi:MAG: GntR family transcriptional regulator [Chloroflexota bacterium]
MPPATLLTMSRQQRSKYDSQSEMAYQILKEKIITLELPPASLLNEAELMDELELGRTPIREALRQLAFENLVVILPRRGTIVADVNASDLQKIFEIRLDLEVCAVRLATERATPDQIREMEKLFEGIDDTVKQGDHHELIALDHQAHVMIAQASHNEFLETMLDRLYTHILRLWYVSLHEVSHLSDAVVEHQELVTAIKARDVQKAEQIMRDHIMGFQTMFLTVL